MPLEDEDSLFHGDLPVCRWAVALAVKLRIVRFIFLEYIVDGCEQHLGNSDNGLFIPRRILSRTLEDGTTMFDAMFSWGSTGIYMSTTLGVATGAYFPFMFLTWANTIIAIILAITGIGMRPKKKTENSDC